MKRLRVVACATAMLLLLTGCGSILDMLAGGGDASSATASTVDPAGRPDAPVSSQAPSSAPLPDSAEAQQEAPNTYVQATGEATSKEYYPSLVLSPDGTFMLTVNLYEGMGHVWGTYTATGQRLECTVVKRDFAGFVGDTMTGFTMDVIDEETLRFGEGGPGGMTEQGAIFTLDNQFPTDDPAMPDVLFTVSADGDGGLNLRSQPAIASQSHGLVPKGTVLEVTNMTKNNDDGEVWYQTRYDGKDGWVSAQYTVWMESKR